MNRVILLVLVAFAFALFPSVRAADPEEEPKLTLAQAKAQFEKADRLLNTAWAAAKKALNAGDFARLLEEQRGWAEWRDHIAMSPNYADVPGDEEHAKKSPGYYSMAASLSEDRATWLNALVAATKSGDDTMTGRWSDSYGGSVDIVEKDGLLYFSFDVVRGRGANVGSICGMAQWHSRIGWFSDKGRDKDKTDEANISFVYNQPKLQVVEAGADYYHGHNATFDGGYVKIADLTDKEQKELIKAGKTGEVSEAK